MQLRLHDLSDAEFGVIHDAVLRYLSEYGMIFEHAEASRILSDAGNEVDSDGRVHMRPGFVEQTLERVPKEGFVLYGRDESRTCRVAVDSFASRPSTGPRMFDHALDSAVLRQAGLRRRRQASADRNGILPDCQL